MEGKRKMLKAKMRAKIALGSLLLVGLVAQGWAQMPDFPEAGAWEARLDEWLKEAAEERDFNGGVLAAADGKVIFKGVYGYADIEKGTPLTLQSSFRLASVSKGFTAMAIMILEQQGKLSYDQPVADFFPEAEWTEVTVRHLLHHTGGLPDYMDEISGRRFSRQKPLTNQAVVEHFSRKVAEPDFRPGRRFEYSNTGYVLLAAIVEEVSGQSFEAFLHQQIFSPLGMKHSRVWNLVSKEPFPSKVVTHRGKRNLRPDWLDGVAGDGGVFCSIEDYLKWDVALRKYQLVDREAWKEATTPGVLSNGKSTDYGFGWIVDEPIMAHDGGWLGARTSVLRNEQNGLLVAVFDSGGNDEAIEVIVRKLLKLF